MKAQIGLLGICLSAVVTAQTITTGEVTGIVMDASGARVINAAVLLKSVDTGETRTGQSSAYGIYRFVFVKPGAYEISSASAGLKSETGRLSVAVGQVQVVDLNLKPEETKDVVFVTDAAPLLNSDNANITYTLSTRQLELLPLHGGDLTSVAYSMPGVVINTRSGNGNFAALGLGSMSNLFTVNGADDMDPYFNVNNSGVSGLLLGANEVREASIVQNAYEGQYGRQAGAQVNYVTKSGTNAYHGNLVYSYNGTLLNANDFFSNSLRVARPQQVSNQYAASLGGPIIRDKLFFFADTEGMRFAIPTSATVVAIPSPALESYSLRTIQPSQVPLYQQMFDLYNSAPGHERAVPVTNGNSPLQDSTGHLGCGALSGIPTGTGGAFGQDVSCAQAWGVNVTNHTSEWLLSTRVDYNISDKQRVFFRFKTDNGFLPVYGLTSFINPVFSINSVQPDYEGQVNHTFVITPRLVNNFIGSASYNDYVFSDPNLTEALKLLPFRLNLRNGGASGAFGFTPIGAATGYYHGRRAGQLQVVDDVSYSAGRHSLKAGVNYRYNREADLNYLAGQDLGVFNLSRLSEFAAGALNPPSASVYIHASSTTPVLHLRLYNLGAYVQDQWTISPHLKLNATLRLDRTGNPYCIDHCFARFTTQFPELNRGLSVPYNQSIETGLAHAFYGVEPVVAQPRVSLVYNPGWSKGTVFRGGIGVFSDLYAALFADRMAGNAPNVFTSFIRTGLVGTGPGSAPDIASVSETSFRSQFPIGATLAQLRQAVSPSLFSPPGYKSIPSTLGTPKYLEWSFEIQHQFGAKNVVTLRYLGNHGYNIFLSNANVNASADPALYPYGFAGLPAMVPDPRFSVVSQLTNKGYSNFHGLATIFRRGFGHGFEGQISYTWSHALDTISNGGQGGAGVFNYYQSLTAQINPFDVRSLSYSNADYDVRHNFTADFIWEIPAKFKRRMMNTVFTGWSVAGRLSAHTGTPFSVINGGVPGLSNFGGTVLADVLDPNVQRTCGHAAVNTPCFTPSQFAASQADLGNLPRNSFWGPGFFDLDTSVYRTVSVGERMRFTFGASAFNVLNHPNFGDPNSDVSAGGLGLINFTAYNPSGPYGLNGGPSGRALVINGRFAF